MQINSESEHWEHFYINNLKVGILSVFTTYNKRIAKFISQFELIFEIGGQVTAYTNKIIYNPIEGRIEWTENIFSEGSVQKKLVFQDGILKVDNENLNDLIPKNSIPDFAYYLLLSTLNFERKRKYDFTYIDSKTGTLIYNSSLELIRNDIIVIDTNNYNALFIQEQKSNSKANQFWITKEGEILKSDWQGAVSIKANDKKEVCQDLSPRLKELLN